jgi:hypothetical protein
MDLLNLFMFIMTVYLFEFQCKCCQFLMTDFLREHTRRNFMNIKV